VRFAPETPANCPRPSGTTSDTSSVESGVAHYFPLYYFAVGWPAHVSSTVVGFYGMRAVSLLVSSLLLALAVTTTVRTVGPRWASLALPVAVTPQVLWLGSVVNPNGWEVDASLLVWAAALALVSRNSTESPKVLWAKIALGAAVVALMRRLGPLWLVLMLVGVLAVWSCLPTDRRRELRSVLSRRGRVVLGVVAGLATVSAWWHLTFDHVFVSGLSGVQNPNPPPPGGLAETLLAIAADPLGWVDQTYGRFGWLDTYSPWWIVLIWLAVGSVLFALVVLGSRNPVRVVVAVAIAVALWVAIPLAFEASVGQQIGIHFWQARYTMPLGLGIPLALAVLGAHWRQPSVELGRLLHGAPPVAWLLWPAFGTATFVVALHRFTAGADAAWSLDGLSWAPPGGFAPALVLAVLGGVALVGAVQLPPQTKQDFPQDGRGPTLERAAAGASR
jgi:hypothetical protein